MKDKILVLHSGGLDSTVLLYKALREVQGDPSRVKALNIIYGQKHAKEAEYAQWHCRHLGIEQIDANLSDVFKFNPNVSSLLAASEVPLEHTEYVEQTSKANGRPVVSYIPYRNGLFLSYAAAVAYQLGFNVIYYGAHADDAAGSAYPDCSQDFIQAQARAIWLGTGNTVRIEAPWAALNKAGVVHAGLELGMTPYELMHTWSCYEGGLTPCGECGTCRDRRAAFEANGIYEKYE